MSGMSNEELWKAVLGEMEISISKAQFNTWFKDTSILSREDGRVVIGVPNGFSKEWLENKVNIQILQSLRRLQSDIQEFSCVIVSNNQTELQQQPNNSAASQPQNQNDHQIQQSVGKQENASMRPVSSMSNLAFQRPATHTNNAHANTQPARGFSFSAPQQQNSSFHPRYTFDSFIVGENNELAKAACYAVSQNPGHLYNPLFIYGGVGLGKTHLLQSIGNEVLRRNPMQRVKYITAELFTNNLIESIRNQKVNEFKEAYSQIDLLIIDDIQFLSGREKTQNEFFHIFNSLYQVNKQIVISSDRPPQSIPTLEDRLQSRFQGGMIADISRPNFETRMAILKVKAGERHFHLDDDVLRFIAENVTNNVRELEGALNRIVASCEFHKVVPSLAYIKKLLGTIITSTQKNITPEHIMKVTAGFYNISEDDLTRKVRKKEIVHPRQVAMYIMRSELKTSFSAIGKYFGGRDHTTVLHAFEKVQQDLDENLRLKEEIASLKEALYREK